MEDPRKFYAKLVVGLLAVALLASPVTVSAQTVYEIWYPNATAEEQAGSICVFRKKLSLIDPEEALIYVTTSGDYELFVNGKSSEAIQYTGTTGKHNVVQYLTSGVNLISLKTTHAGQRPPSVAVKFRVRELGEQRWRSLTTDDSWIAHQGAPKDWYAKYVNERLWSKAEIINPAKFVQEEIVLLRSPNARFELASTSKKIIQTEETNDAESQVVGSPSPSGNEQVELAESKPIDLKTTASENKRTLTQTPDQRFSVDSEFKIEQVMTDKETGSVIAMAFNEFGNLIMSREGGPLIVADVTKEPGDPERVKVLCNEMNTCQGILPLNGKLFVTGKGPSGVGLYRLVDADRDGVFSVDSMLFKFEGGLSEHGPHAIRLGPDGMLYVIVGNASKYSDQPATSSPYSSSYEGDLIPRLEDPGGHAVGVKAPGGTVIRSSLSGDFVETVCGGIRNAYDFVFDQYGELFLHDSDLETNIGMAWYRPTRIYHAPHGAELGWRSGWSKFPNYFADVIPPVVETGRGSPSGAVLYQHFQFPARFHNSMFFADWSEGRILNARPTPEGSSFTLEVEEFLTGKPMNVTDLDVGMDGTLFFCTGAAGPQVESIELPGGAKYRTSCTNTRTALKKSFGCRNPMPLGRRQASALIKRELNQDWGQMLEGIALDARNDVSYRLRSLNLMFFPWSVSFRQL